MTENTLTPNLAKDLLRIHKAITRGLLVSKEKGAEFLQTGFPGTGTRQGYADYAQSLTIVLGAHHTSEDEIGFPFFRQKLPSAPYERLIKSHQEIVVLLDSFGDSIQQVRENGDKTALTRLVEGLWNITAIWRPHIQTEETYFTEDTLGAAASPEEQGRVSAAMAKHSQEHAIPGYLTLPFVMYNLDGEDRAWMAASLPRMVVEELIPAAWKEQWAAMKPFLLE